jgi:hypothetical protein
MPDADEGCFGSEAPFEYQNASVRPGLKIGTSLQHLSNISRIVMNRHANRRRRMFLKGFGVSMALPALEVIESAPVSAADGESGSPIRSAFIYVPNGAQQDRWFPSGSGKSFELSSTMKPLESVREQIQVITGLDHQHAEAGPDGAGDHARANATFLTGMRARKTSSSNIHVGQSIDQLIAESVGQLTKFSSLELTCDAIRKSGRCDSGYSCAYQYNVSWRTPVTPMTPEPNPRNVFERLFGDQDPSGRRQQQIRRAEQRSILDFVLEDANQLRKQLGKADHRKVDEYMSGIREIEQRIERMEFFPTGQLKDFAAADQSVPDAIPPDYAEQIDVMFELLALAFQTDTTRIATLMMAHDGSNRSFPEIGIQEGHHNLTHRQEEQDACEKVAKIDVFYMKRLAKFLQRLRSTADSGDATLLDNSMIVYGSGIADANRHTHDNLPLILAGSGGGRLNSGRVVDAGSQPMSNLFLSIADRMGVENVERFGDSTGRFTDV